MLNVLQILQDPVAQKYGDPQRIATTHSSESLDASQEREWVSHARHGEAQAVTALYRMHHQPVRAFAQRLVGDADHAEDLVQEVFVRLPRMLERFRGDSKLRTFLLGAVVNLGRKHIRAAQRRRATAERAAKNAVGESIPPDAQLERAQQAQALSRALDRLPHRQRAAFVLIAVEQHSHGEAAGILGVPEATVRTRYYHARKRLQTSLRKQEL